MHIIDKHLFKKLPIMMTTERYDDPFEVYEEWREAEWRKFIKNIKPVYKDPIADQIAHILKEEIDIKNEQNQPDFEECYEYEGQTIPGFSKLEQRFYDVNQLKDNLLEDHQWKQLLNNIKPEFNNNPDARIVEFILNAKMKGHGYKNMQRDFIMKKAGLGINIRRMIIFDENFSAEYLKLRS